MGEAVMAGTALVGPVAPRRRRAFDVGRLRPGQGAIGWALAFTAMFATGAVGTRSIEYAWIHWGSGPVAASADPTAQTLRRMQDEIARLKGSVDTLRTAAEASRQDEALRTLRRGVESLRTDLQQARNADSAALQQIAAKLDKADRDPKLADLSGRLDKLEHPAARPADAGTPKGSESPALPAAAAPAAQARTAAASPATSPVPTAPRPARDPVPETAVPRNVPVPPVKPDLSGKVAAARAATVDAWVVRDVYNGMALVEGRQGLLREVEPGEYLPGAGQVRAIERRGRAWVVLTSRGVIEASTF